MREYKYGGYMNISSSAELVVRKSAGHYVSSLLKDKYSEFMANCLLAFVKNLETKLPKLASKIASKKEHQYASRLSKKFNIPGTNLQLKIQALILVKEQLSTKLELKIQRIEVMIPELRGIDSFGLSKALDEAANFVLDKEIFGL